MAAFHPRVEDLPGEFPVFPLPGALLLPRGKLPLNIFEPRYLAMTEDALGQGRMFGMIQPDPTLPETETGPGLFRVGCLGRLSSFSETDDGRYLITLTGVIRFAVAAEMTMRRGYRRVRGDFTPYRADLDLETAADRRRPRGAAGGAARLFHPPRLRRQLGCDQAPAGRHAGRDPGHGLPVRAGGEAGAAGGARPMRSGPRPCWRCCRWARWRRITPAAAA